MTKFLNNRNGLKLVASRNWTFNFEPYSQVPRKTFDQVNDDLRLRRVIKRAVERDYAPQSLIDSIKKSIRG